MDLKDRLVVALDVGSRNELVEAVRTLSPLVRVFKVGPRAILAFGLKDILEILSWHGAQAFVDLKFNDIPSTVAAAAAVLATCRDVRYFTVHASAGRAAMEAAAKAAGEHQQVLAVTVLTSLDRSEAWDVFGDSLEHKVAEFAHQAFELGAAGMVCSAGDLNALRGCDFAKALLKVVPGVRPRWSATADQRRTSTPADAVRAGADVLVIGRPVLYPPRNMTPADAVEAVLSEIASALESTGEGARHERQIPLRVPGQRQL